MLLRLLLLKCLYFVQNDPKTGAAEGLSHDFNLCEAVATWEQVSQLVLFIIDCSNKKEDMKKHVHHVELEVIVQSHQFYFRFLL